LTIKTIISQEKKSLEILDLELLISFVIKKNRDFIFLNPNFELNENEIWELKKLIKKRKNWFSLAVLIWEKEFYWRDFFVNENVLIPRPDTEILIDEVLSIFEKWDLEVGKWINILDIWTWSWIIPITLSLELKKYFYEKKINTSTGSVWRSLGSVWQYLGSVWQSFISKITWLDISKKALEVAKKNTEKFDLKIDFLESDLLWVFEKEKKNIKILRQAQDDKQFSPTRQVQDNKQFYFHIITANLPYVEEWYFDKSISKEPGLALFSWEKWLNHYLRLFEELKKWTVDFKFLFMEMADFQVDEIANLFSYFWEVSIIKDTEGKRRIVKIVKNI